MPTRAEWAAQPLDKRLDRLARTPDDLDALIRGRSDADLSRRPDARNWAAKEIVCHLRDIEELAVLRFRMMLWTDEPKVPAAFLPTDRRAWGLLEDGAMLVDPDRWAEERQYLRAEAGAAVAAFRRRRADTLAFLSRLDGSQWPRGSLHPTLGRFTFEDWVSLLAGHDDNHLAQLERALDGRV
ncbi:MAG: DinB family protein [candidate division NC10 bacterium]